MADSKVIDLPAVTTPSSEDIVHIITDPNGTPTDKKVTVENLRGTTFEGYNGSKYLINNPYAEAKSLHLKGQMHCHTTNSDGADSPTDLVTAYKNAGYDFITITDHDVLTADPGVAGITWLGVGCEENYYGVAPSGHVCGYDLDTQSTNTDLQKIFDYHRNNNKLVSFAHPSAASFYSNKDQMAELYGFNLLEVYNGITATEQVDWGLSSGKKFFLIAVDDCHNVTTGVFNEGWVVVHTDTNSKAAILAALREGNFYASTGNDISLSLVGNVLTAASVGSSNFVFYGKHGRILKTENGVTSSEYTILGDEGYVRVESTLVADSTVAWSQPIFIDLIVDDGESESRIRGAGFNQFLTRQAIINGNFDIWQRAETSTTNSGGVTSADHWFTYLDAGGGTGATITHSKQSAKGLKNAFNCFRMAANQATSLGATGRIEHWTKIEHGTRFLSGLGRKITVSFFAKSDLAGKRVGLRLLPYYGTGGTPSASEIINGTNFTLTSNWKKYSFTFEMNTLIWPDKTFGSDNNDYLRLDFMSAWAANYKAQVGSDTDENFSGAGFIDFAKVQMHSDAEDSSFQPRTYADELRDCKRFYQKMTVRVINGIMYYLLPVEMYTTPSASASAGTIANATKNGFQITHTSNADSEVILEAEIV